MLARPNAGFLEDPHHSLDLPTPLPFLTTFLVLYDLPCGVVISSRVRLPPFPPLYTPSQERRLVRLFLPLRFLFSSSRLYRLPLS